MDDGTQQPTHHDILVQQAVMKNELSHIRGDITEIKASHSVFQTHMTKKLDEIGAQMSSLQGQRTVVAGIVSAIVAAAIATIGPLLRKM